MSKFSYFAERKLYFKLSFDNISGNSGPLFSQINFDHTYFGVFVRGVFGTGVYVGGVYVGGVYVGGVYVGGVYVGVYVLEPNRTLTVVLFRFDQNIKTC